MNDVFYNKYGEAIAYSIGEDIYLFSGEPVAYLFGGNCVYSFFGKQLGWFENGWIIDLNGYYVFFTDNAFGGPLKPLKHMLPLRSLRSLKPMKGLKEMRHSKPTKKTTWSQYSGRDFFGYS